MPLIADPIRQYPADEVYPVFTPSAVSSLHKSLFLLNLFPDIPPYSNSFSLKRAKISGNFVIKFEVSVARSFEEVKCCSSGNPVEFLKSVLSIPSAPAYAFIKSTNPSSVPPTYSEIATAASFPD